jgi:hypothetical protein
LQPREIRFGIYRDLAQRDAKTKLKTYPMANVRQSAAGARAVTII